MDDSEVKEIKDKILALKITFFQFKKGVLFDERYYIMHPEEIDQVINNLTPLMRKEYENNLIFQRNIGKI